MLADVADVIMELMLIDREVCFLLVHYYLGENLRIFKNVLFSVGHE